MPRAPVVVCNEAHRFLVAEQLREMGMPPAAILLEPVGRNTAPAIALAAHAARQLAGDDALMLVLPADHVLQDLAAFQAAIRLAIPAAASGKLVAFGIVARTPETGYGYLRIERGAGAGAVAPIAQFVEKPDAARAQRIHRLGRLLLELGHVPVRRAPLSRRARGARARHRRCVRARQRHGGARKGLHARR